MMFYETCWINYGGELKNVAYQVIEKETYFGLNLNNLTEKFHFSPSMICEAPPLEGKE